ncbi:MAG TPA: nuclear transport factor 2 family protein [Gemmatimonadaceae bacterium]
MEGHDETALILRQLTDKHAIAAVLIRYATALDTRDWELFRTCFTADAVADYGALGGENEGLAAIEAVVKSLEGFDATQHLIGNIAVEIAGDGARATCYLQAQHAARGAEGGECFTIAGTYRDRIVRTESGWRISHRELEVAWTDGNPRVLELAAQRAPMARG